MLSRRGRLRASLLTASAINRTHAPGKATSVLSDHRSGPSEPIPAQEDRPCQAEFRNGCLVAVAHGGPPPRHGAGPGEAEGIGGAGSLCPAGATGRETLLAPSPHSAVTVPSKSSLSCSIRRHGDRRLQRCLCPESLSLRTAGSLGRDSPYRWGGFRPTSPGSIAGRQQVTGILIEMNVHPFPMKIHVLLPSAAASSQQHLRVLKPRVREA